jgi:hypothetical protein
MFGTDEADFTLAERNDESLRSWTLSWLFDIRTHLRLGAELTQLSGERADTADPDGRTVTFEARYTF